MSETIESATSKIHNIFDPVFELYRNLYLRIFELIYPAFGSTGFTERNLTANFSKAYETFHPGAITWFEMPFSKRLHLDAIIIDPSSKTMLFIESKRFSNVTSKVSSVGNDIRRINKAIRAQRYSIRAHVAGYDNFPNRYGVILSDVWTENDEKINLHSSFQSNSFPVTHLTRCEIASTEIPDATCFTRDFSGLVDVSAIRDHYKLLGMIWNAPAS